MRHPGALLKAAGSRFYFFSGQILFRFCIKEAVSVLKTIKALRVFTVPEGFKEGQA